MEILGMKKFGPPILVKGWVLTTEIFRRPDVVLSYILSDFNFWLSLSLSFSLS